MSPKRGEFQVLYILKDATLPTRAIAAQLLIRASLHRPFRMGWTVHLPDIAVYLLDIYKSPIFTNYRY